MRGYGHTDAHVGNGNRCEIAALQGILEERFHDASTMTAEDPLELVGTTVDAKYALSSLVGEGGFAVVYKAEHLLWKRPVAVKVFRALAGVAKTDRERFLQDFIQEGAILAELSERSASIVQARDVGLVKVPGGEVPYMVLEWLEGASLERILEDERASNLPLRTLEEAIRLLDPVAQGLSLAHMRGIAHRDIKPANVFVIGDPRSPGLITKLLDFGIAKVVSNVQNARGGFHMTSGVGTAFTPSYGAPEQFSRDHGATGPWTDVFALALMVGAIVTGKEPLEGNNMLQLAVAACNPSRRPTLRTLGASVSDEVEAVFKKATALEARDRYEHAGVFWQALRRAAGMGAVRLSMADTPADSGEEGRTSINGLQSASVMSQGVIIAVPSASSPAAEPSGATHSPKPSQASVPTIAATQPSAGMGTHGTLPATSSDANVAPGAGVLGPQDSQRRASRRNLASLVAISFGLVSFGAFLAHRTPLDTAAKGPLVAAASASPKTVPGATSPPSCPNGMAAIPSGTFFMGSAEKDSPFEKRAERTTVKAFCLDRTEITVEDYKRCTEGGRCQPSTPSNQWRDISPKDRTTFDPLCNARNPEERRHHPINCVDWNAAATYCQAQGKRLPSEAEWEYAARGPDGRRYPWGDEPPSPQRANTCDKDCETWKVSHHQAKGSMYSASDGHETTAPVGTFPKGASPFGLMDMAGNVWEWVADPYDGDAEQRAGLPIPTGERVLRGGGWMDDFADDVRTTTRLHAPPSQRSTKTGFRCALTP